MKIVSKFTDYYDRMQAYGLDGNLTFYRKFEYIGCTFRACCNVYDQGTTEYALGCVGFCGTIYNYILKVDSNKSTKKKDDKLIYSNPKIFYNHDEFMKEYKPKWPYQQVSKDYFIPHHDAMLVALFEEYNTPIFAITDFDFNPKTCIKSSTQHYADLHPNNPLRTGTGLYINPPLADHSFQKVMSAEVAFQEISQYLGRDKLTAEDALPVSDVIKTERAGFDKKTSFRKRKEPK